MSNASDRNLLFGILALQTDFIDRDALIAAMHAWVLDKVKPLGEILVAQQILNADERNALDLLVQKHIDRHEGDVRKSLAAVPVSARLGQELHSLADADVQATVDLLPTPAAPPLPNLLPTTVTEKSSGKELRYRILRPHDKGGIGEVFVALDQELNREVALKEMQQRYADDKHGRCRFVREAEITGCLEHPGIVPVYGLGTYADGRPYYAMRFIRGASLRDAIGRYHHSGDGKAQSRELERRGLLTRFVAVCNAIAYAHSRSVIHRDLKPANIMLGQYGETLVVDWGLAKLVAEEGKRSESAAEPALVPRLAHSVETQHGTTLGTPAYMSPEQASGRLDLLGPASDIYSLGATLYTLLTGRPPIEGKNTMEVLRKAQRGEWLPVRQAKADVPAALAAICHKAMAAASSARYGTALAMAADVENWLADDPVSAYREPPSARVGRWMRRHRPLVTGVAAAVLVALASLAAATTMLSHANRNEKQAREQAERHAEEARGNFRLARQAVDDYSLKVSEDRRLREGFRPLRRELLQAAVPFYERLAARGGDDPSVREDLARAAAKLGSITREIDSLKKAIPHYEQAVAVLEALTAEFPQRISAWTELAEFRLDLGRVRLATGDFAGAEEALLAAVELQRRLATEQTGDPVLRSNLATGLTFLGEFDRTTGRVEDAEAHYQEAIGLLRRLVREHADAASYQAKLAQVYRSLGVLYGARSRLQDQEQAYLESLRLCQGLTALAPGDERHQETLASIQHDLGILYANQHRYGEADKAYRDALALAQALAEKHPELISYQRDVANTKDDLGTLYQKTGRLAEAETIHHESVSLMQRLADRYPEVVNHLVNLAGAQMNLGQVLRKRGKAAASLEWLDRGIRNAEAILRKERRHDQAHEFLSIGHEGRALALKELGRHAEAVHDLEQALAHEKGPYRTTLRAERARTNARAGNSAAARAEADDLVKRPDALHANDFIILGFTHVVLAATAAGDATLSTTQRERHVGDCHAQAVALFNRAYKAGYFKEAGEHKEFLTDKELDPLRMRADFQELIRRLEAMK